MSKNHPCVFFTLHPGDEGYDKGFERTLEDVDGNVYYFRNETERTEAIQMHGLVQINQEDMIAIREGRMKIKDPGEEAV
jgi:hypothetical protein